MSEGAKLVSLASLASLVFASESLENGQNLTMQVCTPLDIDIICQFKCVHRGAFDPVAD